MQVYLLSLVNGTSFVFLVEVDCVSCPIVYYILTGISCFYPGSAQALQVKLLERKGKRTFLQQENKQDMSREDKASNPSHDDPYCACLFINRKYVLPKMFYFFYFAGLGAVLPYQPLFYKELGIPAKKAGIISGIQPFISFLFTPVWGALADKFKKGKLIFTVSFVALVAVGIAYLLTPVPSCNDEPSREIIMKGNHSFLYRISQTIAESHRWPMERKEKEINLLTLQQSEQSEEDKEFDVFLYLLLVCLFGTLFSCPGLALGDAAVVCLLRRNDDVHKYGKQKKWASIGWGLAAFSFGAIVSDRYLCPFVPGKKPIIDYRFCFYGSITLKILALLSGLRLEFDVNGDKNDNKNMNSENGRGVIAAIRAVSEPCYVAFFVVVLYSGMTFGMIMGFFFWHLEDCSAPQILFSIIPVVRCIADVIVYMLSPRLITKIGLHNLIYLVLVGYVTRLACYSFIISPWYFLPLELMSGLTSAGGWVAFVSYIGYHSVEGAPATLQGKYFPLFHVG